PPPPPPSTLFPYTTLFRSLPRLVHQLSGNVLQVDVLASKLIRQLLAQVGRHRLRLGRVVGEKREGFDVEHEALRRSSGPTLDALDRKSTRLNSSHLVISYA